MGVLLPWAVLKALNGGGTSAYHPQPLTCITVAVAVERPTPRRRIPRKYHQKQWHLSRRQLQIINQTLSLKTCIKRKGALRSDGQVFHSEEGNVSVLRA